MALPFKLAPEMSGVETQREAVFSESQRGCPSSWMAIRDRTPTEIAAPRRRVRPGLIGAAENCALPRGLTAIRAGGACRTMRAFLAELLVERNAAHGGSCFFLDFGLAVGAATPIGIGKAVLHGQLELLVISRLFCVRPAEGKGAVVQRLLDFLQKLGHAIDCIRQRDARLAFFAWAVAARQHRGLFRDVFWTQLDPHRYAAHLPVVEFPAGTEAFALVERDTQTGLGEIGLQLLRWFHHGLFFHVGLEDGNNYGLIRDRKSVV